MTKKEQIDADIKQAMLAGEKDLVTTLRGLKSAILYAEVATDSRDTGLSEETVIQLLQKEAKKRQESADLYRQGNDEERATAEEAEKRIIEKYLPAQMSEADIMELVEAAVTKLDNPSLQQMGQIIGSVKQLSKGTADGTVIAKLVKERLSR